MDNIINIKYGTVRNIYALNQVMIVVSLTKRERLKMRM